MASSATLKLRSWSKSPSSGSSSLAARAIKRSEAIHGRRARYRRRLVPHLRHFLHVNIATHTYPSTVNTWIPRTQRAYPRRLSQPAFTLSRIGQRINAIIRHVAIDLFAPSIACSRSLVCPSISLSPSSTLPYPHMPGPILYPSLFGSTL